MLDTLQSSLALTSGELAISAVAVLLAGLVRGFAGFGLSALIMASLVLIMPPSTLIPVCFLLEAMASLIMFRGGLRQANQTIAWGLAITSAIGVPVGLLATITLPSDLSRTIALCLILILAGLQWLNKSPAFLATRNGLYLSGFVAGVSTGLAGVGGMVVALYVLAQKAPAVQMRASLVMYLFLGMFTSVIWLSLSGLLDTLALKRAVMLSPMLIIGVLVGTALFKPSLQQFYRQFCLTLLLVLALAGLARLALAR